MRADRTERRHSMRMIPIVDAMNHAEKECSEISDKIIELNKELNEL